MIFNKTNFNLLKGLGLAPLALLAASCHNPVFDYEGDCEVTYQLQFVYDMNLNWSDAFPSLTNRVNLYAFDSNGKFENEYSLTDPQVFQSGYRMNLDLNPGDYTLVAWAALESGTSMEECFRIPAMTKGVSNLSDLTCSVLTESNEQYPLYSDTRLPFLYNGHLEVNLPDSQDGEDYLYTIYLTKDTNHIRAMIQKVGGDIKEDDVEFRIVAADKEMAWNNNLIGTEKVTYLPWDVFSDELTVGKDEENSAVHTGVVADIMTGRLTTGMETDTFLYVVNPDNETVLFKVPLIQFALTEKSYYELAYNKPMTDKEFLDRKSEFSMTFIVDEGINLLYTVIEVLEWRIIIKDYNVES